MGSSNIAVNNSMASIIRVISSGEYRLVGGVAIHPTLLEFLLYSIPMYSSSNISLNMDMVVVIMAVMVKVDMVDSSSRGVVEARSYSITWSSP